MTLWFTEMGTPEGETAWVQEEHKIYFWHAYLPMGKLEDTCENPRKKQQWPELEMVGRGADNWGTIKDL